MYGEAASYTGAIHHPDVEEASHIASRHGGSEEDKGLFSSVLSNVLGSHEAVEADHDEIDYVGKAHDRVYNQQEPQEHSSRDLGSAAALQAFKMFSGGSGGSSGSSNELVGMAMGEALKLFKNQSSSGNGGNLDQSEVLQQAAMMAMKLFLTQKQGGESSGGGAVGALMGLLNSGGGSSSSSNTGAMAASLLGKFL